MRKITLPVIYTIGSLSVLLMLLAAFFYKEADASVRVPLFVEAFIVAAALIVLYKSHQEDEED